MPLRLPVCSKTLSLTALLCLGLATGCSVFKPRTKKAPAIAEKGAPKEAAGKPGVWAHNLGKVILVNEGMGFVLVDIGTAPAPEPGVALEAFTDSFPSAQLVVSTYQRRPYLIGDIVSGMPKKGDSIALAPRKISAPQKSKDSPRASEGGGMNGTDDGAPRPIRSQVSQLPRIPVEQSVTEFLPSERENPVIESPQSVGEGRPQVVERPNVRTGEPIIPGLPMRRRAQ